MDANNYMLYKRGLISKEDLVKNSHSFAQSFDQGFDSSLGILENIGNVSENMEYNKLEEIENTCPKISIVREYIMEEVEKINNTLDF